MVEPTLGLPSSASVLDAPKTVAILLGILLKRWALPETRSRRGVRGVLISR